jgi:radical SAM protein (TIGR04043 family)
MEVGHADGGRHRVQTDSKESSELVDLALRSQLAVHGLRADPGPRRASGTGPGDDEHWLLGGQAASIAITPDSPLERTAEGVLTRDGVVIGAKLAPVARPRFYDLETGDGVPYEQIARLHGRHVLATTVVQTCVRYDEDTRCRFCTIEESLRAGTTLELKRPEQLAEVAVAAVRLDGVRQMVMTTGTTRGPDRGAKHLARCVEAVHRAVPRLPIQVQLEPPAGLGWIAYLEHAGATSIGIHVESLDDEVRRRWTPGKATVSLERYEVVWTEAVRVFGRNRVSTYLLVGLGENPDQLVAGAKRLIGMGVYPFVVPYRPLPGSLAEADGVPAPSHDLVADVTDRVAAALRKAGMRGIDQRAGCAACGACSALSTVGG